MDVKQAANAYDAISNIAQNAITDTQKPEEAGSSFSDMLTQAIGSVADKGQKAESLSKLALMGKADLTELATAVSTAETALESVVAIRDKVISAYQQIIQMPM